MIDVSPRPHVRRILVGAAGVLGIGTIGALDYVSGTELRVYPFYWGPVALLAWHFGRRGALGAAVLAAGS
ncbi:MAG TPA: hypothetical protein VMT87_15815, partial [Vicinamibacteria bacterium]|nr:hypothetical protein [Vicinamibacteria bacterium]